MDSNVGRKIGNIQEKLEKEYKKSSLFHRLSVISLGISTPFSTYTIIALINNSKMIVPTMNVVPFALVSLAAITTSILSTIKLFKTQMRCEELENEKEKYIGERSKESVNTKKISKEHLKSAASKQNENDKIELIRQENELAGKEPVTPGENDKSNKTKANVIPNQSDNIKGIKVKRDNKPITACFNLLDEDTLNIVAKARNNSR